MIIILNSQCEAKNKKIIDLECKILEVKSPRSSYVELEERNFLKLDSKIKQSDKQNVKGIIKYQFEKYPNPYPLSHS